MGQSSLDSPTNSITMKMFVVLALAAVACAEPEADPALVYSGVYSPLSYTSGYSPLLRSFTPYTTGYNTFNTFRTFVKRDADADAEPEADPAVVCTVARSFVRPAVTYTTGLNSYVHSFVKRDAEADPALVYNTAAINPVAYSSAAISPVAYSTYNPVVSHVNPFVSYAATPVVASTHQVTNYNNPHHYTAVSNGVFGPKYIAKNHGVEHIVKREAEADPALVVPATYTNIHHTVAQPITYSAGVSPVVYNAVAGVSPVYSAGHHAVAATPFGLTHSSNVGLCFNNVGQAVQC